MDADIWIAVRILYDFVDGAFHVPCCRKIAQTNEPILWNEMGGSVRIHRPGFLLTRICNVGCKKNSG